MTTADSAVCIFYWQILIFLMVVVLFHFGLCAQRKVDVKYFFIWDWKSNFRKKIGAGHSSIFFQDVLLHQKKVICIFFCLEKNGQIQIQKSLKRIGVLCVVVIYLCNTFFFFIPFAILALLSRSLPVVTLTRGHLAGPTPPFPLRDMPSLLSREEFSIFFLSLSTRVELYLLTLLGALCSWSLFFFCVFANKVKSHDGGNRTQGQTLVVFEGDH